MQVLTDEEIHNAIGFTTDQTIAYRRVEVAVLEKFEVIGYFYKSNSGSLPAPEMYEGDPDVYPLYRLKENLLTLDEAIMHAKERSSNTPCGREHVQLAAWLEELREYRNENSKT